MDRLNKDWDLILENIKKQIEENFNRMKYMFHSNSDRIKIYEGKYNTVKDALERRRSVIFSELQHGVKPKYLLIYYNFNLILVATTNQSNIISLDDRTINIIRRSKDFDSVVVIDGIDVENMSYLDFMYLHEKDLIKSLKFNIKWIEVTDKEELEQLPRDVKGLYICYEKISTNLLNSFKFLENLKIYSKTIQVLKYDHSSLKNLYVNKCTNLYSVDVKGSLLNVDISETYVSPLDFKDHRKLEKITFSLIKKPRQSREQEKRKTIDNIHMIELRKPFELKINPVLEKEYGRTKLLEYLRIIVSDNLIEDRSGSIVSLIIKEECPELKCSELERLMVLSNTMIDIRDIKSCGYLQEIILNNISPSKYLSIANVDMFSLFINLTKLVINDFHIKPFYEFNKLASLEELYLNIKDYDYTKKMFRAFKNLKTLTIERGVIKENIFDDIPYLETLTMSSIKDIPDNIFIKLLRLKTLNLNNINVLTDNIFGSLISLEKLRIMNTNIFSLRNNALEPLRNLRYLKIDDNHMLNAPFFFSFLSSLEKLYLRIPYYDKLELSYLSNLKHLTLCFKTRKDINFNNNMLSNLFNLEELDIYPNDSSYIIYNKDAFIDLLNLRSLKLSYAVVDSVNMFIRLKHLNIVNIELISREDHPRLDESKFFLNNKKLYINRTKYYDHSIKI